MQSKPIAWFLNNGYFAEAVVWRCSAEKVFLEIWQNSQENTSTRVFFNKVAGLACNFIEKETWAQEFSCEFCEMSKYIFSYRTSPVAASDLGYKWVQFFVDWIFLALTYIKIYFIIYFNSNYLLDWTMSFFVPKYLEKYKKYIAEYIS